MTKAGLVGAARAKVEAVKSKIQALENQRRERLGELGRVQAQLRDNPAEPDLLQRQEGLRLSIQALNREIPEQYYRDGQPRPDLQLELERARLDYENVRRARWNAARAVREVEDLEARWGNRLPKIQALLRELLDVFGPNGFPERRRQAETELRALQIWAVDTSNAVRSLPRLRDRLAEYGPDDWQPEEVRERGVLGSRPESVRSVFTG